MLNREVMVLVVVGFLSFTATALFPKPSQVERVKYLNPPPEMIEHFHFGFGDSMADSFWLRWIQDSDYCQTYIEPVKKLEVVPDVFKTDSLLANPRHKVCDNSWSFKMLDTVTKLAPKFAMPYLTGAVSLSILVEDFEGATVIFNRAIDNFPNEWPILYRAAYHFLYDKKDLPKAAELMDRAAKQGGPVWLSSLAARLYSRTGQIALGLQTLKAHRETLKEPSQQEFMDKRIRDLEAQLAKERQK